MPRNFTAAKGSSWHFCTHTHTHTLEKRTIKNAGRRETPAEFSAVVFSVECPLPAKGMSTAAVA